MADKKKKRRKDDDEEEKPTKEEYAVAKHLRFNCPVKEGKLRGMPVQFFIAVEAVDTLLKSKWSKGNSALFPDKKHCINYCHTLLLKGLFHRALRVKKDKDKKKRKLKDGEKEEDTADDEKKLRRRKKGKEDSKKEEESEEKKDEGDDGKKDEKKKDEKKKGKKLKLDMHDNQVFADGDEVYVWIYDPTPMKTFIIGLLMVLGSIGLCLFPLWPPEVRVGIYYCSLAGAGFVGVIIGLIVIRTILFCLVWAFTFGKHHFWFLPNLTEDVGFFDSFKPLYEHNVKTADKSAKKPSEKSKKNKKKDKNSDKDDNVDESEAENEENEKREKEMTDNEEEVSCKNGREQIVNGSNSSGSVSGDFEVVQEEDFKSM